MSKKLIVILLVIYISACSNIQPKNEAVKINKELSEVINKYSGNILYPKNIQELKNAELNVGQVFNYILMDSNGTKSSHKQVLVKSTDQEQTFDYYVDNKRSKFYGFMYKEGIKYYITNDGKPSFKALSFGECEQFNIGSCQYVDPLKKKKVLTIKFDNGVWTYTSKGLGLSRNTHTYVFDKNGIILYKEFSNGSRWDRLVIQN